MKMWKQTLIVGAGVMLVASGAQAQTSSARGAVASSSSVVQQTEELEELVDQETSNIYNSDYQNRQRIGEVSDRIDFAYTQLREKYEESANTETPTRQEFLPDNFVENQEDQDQQ